jgi:hypothetical protein
MSGIRAAVLGSFVMATASTLGDFIWATWITAHRGVYGVTHGVLLFLIAGLVLGVPAKRPAAGAVAGALVGALGAGSFYVLAPLLGYSAMFVSWIGVWVALAIAHARLHARRPSVREVASRGALAAMTSGIAFYAISGIWQPFDPSGWDYAVHFAAWTIAYLPGFVFLFARLPAHAGSHAYINSGGVRL